MLWPLGAGRTYLAVLIRHGDEGVASVAMIIGPPRYQRHPGLKKPQSIVAVKLQDTRLEQSRERRALGDEAVAARIAWAGRGAQGVPGPWGTGWR